MTRGSIALAGITFALLCADACSHAAECSVAADCPGDDTCASVRTCTDGTCGSLVAPSGTACSGGVCDGAGECAAGRCVFGRASVATGQNDYFGAVVRDSQRNVIAVGTFNLPPVGGLYPSAVLVAKYDTAGAEVWHRTFGGTADAEDGIAAVADGSDGVIVMGTLASRSPSGRRL